MTTVDTNALLQVGLAAAEAYAEAEPGTPAEFTAAETVCGMLVQLHRELRSGAHLPAIWCCALPPIPIGSVSGAGL